MKRAWSKLPSRWIRKGALCAFRASDDAALKLYLAYGAFAALAPFKPSRSAEVAGRVCLSFTELAALCAISRRVASRGCEVEGARVDHGATERSAAPLPRGDRRRAEGKCTAFSEAKSRMRFLKPDRVQIVSTRNVARVSTH